MLNFNITIGQKFLRVKATRHVVSKTSIDSSSKERSPIGIQSGLFGDAQVAEDKMLYEKRARRDDSPRMVVEQVNEVSTTSSIPQIVNNQKVFRPLWVTVPVDNDMPVFPAGKTYKTKLDIKNMKKYFSVIQTWFTYFDERVTKNIASTQQMVSRYARLSLYIRRVPETHIGLQPALFDATPIASMDHARYIASRESFSGDGIFTAVAWKFPTVKFVLSVPGKQMKPVPHIKADLNVKNLHQVNTIHPISYARISTFHTIFPYIVGSLAVIIGVLLNFFFLQY